MVTEFRCGRGRTMSCLLVVCLPKSSDHFPSPIVLRPLCEEQIAHIRHAVSLTMIYALVLSVVFSFRSWSIPGTGGSKLSCAGHQTPFRRRTLVENWLVTGSSSAEIAYFLSQLKGQYAEGGKTSSSPNRFHLGLIAKKMPSGGCLYYFRISKYETILGFHSKHFKKQNKIYKPFPKGTVPIAVGTMITFPCLWTGGGGGAQKPPPLSATLDPVLSWPPVFSLTSL